MPQLLNLPAVDGVEITTIMDNSLDLLLASTPIARRFPLQNDALASTQLRAEHGASFLVTVIDQGKRSTILFDTTIDEALMSLPFFSFSIYRELTKVAPTSQHSLNACRIHSITSSNRSGDDKRTSIKVVI